MRARFTPNVLELRLLTVSEARMQEARERLENVDELTRELEECFEFPSEERTNPAIKLERALYPLKDNVVDTTFIRLDTIDTTDPTVVIRRVQK